VHLHRSFTNPSRPFQGVDFELPLMSPVKLDFGLRAVRHSYREATSFALENFVRVSRPRPRPPMPPVESGARSAKSLVRSHLDNHDAGFAVPITRMGVEQFFSSFRNWTNGGEQV